MNKTCRSEPPHLDYPTVLLHPNSTQWNTLWKNEDDSNPGECQALHAFCWRDKKPASGTDEGAGSNALPDVYA